MEFMELLGAGVVDGAELLRRAQVLTEVIESHALESERSRRVVDEVFVPISEAGLTNLTLSRSLGGSELDPVTSMEVIETISHADGATGWVTMILNGSLIADWIEPAAAEAMTAGGGFRLAGMFGPVGKAVPEGDGYRLTGRRPFNSGSVHANWMLGGCFVMDGSQPALRADGRPDWRFAVFPAAEFEIHDTWHAAGLRASSSHDASVVDLFVPEVHLVAPMLRKVPSGKPTADRGLSGTDRPPSMRTGAAGGSFVHGRCGLGRVGIRVLRQPAHPGATTRHPTRDVERVRHRRQDRRPVLPAGRRRSPL
jgi:alkylation response protein AidB-like acyl-CoA dehydrogenase